MSFCPRTPIEFRALSLLALLCLPSAHSYAEHDATEEAEAHPHHTLGVFLGDTTENRREGGTLGLEYEYRFNADFGLGLTVEHVFGDFDTNVLVLPLAYHREAWKFYVGPGREYSEGEAEPLLRVGIEYGFEAGELEISPQLDLDFVDGEQLVVFGVVFALRF